LFVVPDVFDKVEARHTHPRTRIGTPTERLSRWMRTGFWRVPSSMRWTISRAKLFVDYLSELKRQLIRRRLEERKHVRGRRRPCFVARRLDARRIDARHFPTGLYRSLSEYFAWGRDRGRFPLNRAEPTKLGRDPMRR